MADAASYGLQPRWWTPDRLFRVHVAPDLLAGLYVAGQFHDAASGAIQLQALGALVVLPFVLARRRTRERRYDAVDPFDPVLLDYDKRNFHLRRADVLRTRFRRNRSYWTPFNVGSVEFDLRDGTTRRLILVGDQNPDAVLDLLKTFEPNIEVSGEPAPPQKPMSPVARRRAFLLMAVVFLGFGGMFVAAAVLIQPPNPMHVVIGPLNLIAGVVSLLAACRKPPAQPPPPEDQPWTTA